MALNDTIGFDNTLRGLSAGQRLSGRYELIRELGRGGMGVVWLAKDLELRGDEIALKMLPSFFEREQEAVYALQEEARVAMRLSHPGIVRLHTMERMEDGLLFLVMEYLRGPSLKELLWERKKDRSGNPDPLLNEDEIRGLRAQVSEALNYAHKRRVIHRDIKPGNLMLEYPVADPLAPIDLEKNQIKICDFGIARVLEDTHTHLTGTPISGTIRYMSPEQIRGKNVSYKSDVYSLGCLLYEAIAGNPPFQTGDISHQHIHESPPPLPNPHHPEESWIIAALAKEVSDRPELVAPDSPQKEADSSSRHHETRQDVPQAVRTDEPAPHSEHVASLGSHRGIRPGLPTRIKLAASRGLYVGASAGMLVILLLHRSYAPLIELRMFSEIGPFFSLFLSALAGVTVGGWLGAATGTLLHGVFFQFRMEEPRLTTAEFCTSILVSTACLFLSAGLSRDEGFAWLSIVIGPVYGLLIYGILIAPVYGIWVRLTRSP